MGIINPGGIVEPRVIEEVPCYEDGQILRLEIYDSNFKERHYLEISEHVHDVQKNYRVIGKEKLLTLSHHFDTVYGVSILAGMDPQTAIKIGEKMVEWGKENDC